MANTLIQIKRSTTTAKPAALYVGEQGYSYNSGKLFIGTTGSDDVIEIGGKYFVDHLNAVWTYANTLGSSTASTDYANNVGTAGNAYAVSVGTSGNNYADAVGTSGNAYAVSVGTSGNAYAEAVGTSANAYTAATYLPLSGGTVTGDLTVSANLTVTGTTTFVNTQSLLVSDNIFVLNADLNSGTAASQDAGMQVNRGSDANVYVLWNESTNKWTFTNDGSTYVNFVGNTELETVATSANAYATAVGTSGNAYAVSVGTSGNNYADAVGTSGNAFATAVGTSGNAYATAVGTSSNAYADAVGTAANTNAANASYITTGTLAVTRGGTGNTSLTNNGVLVGRGTSAVSTVYSSDEGNILQINSAGVPAFGFLDGGSF